MEEMKTMRITVSMPDYLHDNAEVLMRKRRLASVLISTFQMPIKSPRKAIMLNPRNKKKSEVNPSFMKV